ncbi:hypothetical protein TREES_T100017044 [Tupaia chinensis]|uniref:Uncharacterized protein n=1 Tax=Tupaia chinensis TaxID=246437 RepID=L9KZG2_TUPCH|nr:hypothetical protein TREES_T100017044 [Tupaia chinensis]
MNDSSEWIKFQSEESVAEQGESLAQDCGSLSLSDLQTLSLNGIDCWSEVGPEASPPTSIQGLFHLGSVSRDSSVLSKTPGTGEQAQRCMQPTQGKGLHPLEHLLSPRPGDSKQDPDGHPPIDQAEA